MALFIVTFSIMLLAVVGMAVGVLFGRSPIAGSCGGLNAVNDSGECGACSRPCSARRNAQLQAKFTGQNINQPGTL